MPSPKNNAAPTIPIDESQAFFFKQLSLVGGSQFEERHNSALPLVAGAHDERDILDSDYKGQRPEYQRKQAKNGVGRN
jgi:hypothetical protein